MGLAKAAAMCYHRHSAGDDAGDIRMGGKDE